jgi:hypothetical protein
MAVPDRTRLTGRLLLIFTICEPSKAVRARDSLVAGLASVYVLRGGKLRGGPTTTESFD